MVGLNDRRPKGEKIVEMEAKFGQIDEDFWF
jgi:hypothetical protein